MTQNVVRFRPVQANLNEVALIDIENSLLLKADRHLADQCRGYNCTTGPCHEPIVSSLGGATRTEHAFVNCPVLWMPLRAPHFAWLDRFISI